MQILYQQDDGLYWNTTREFGLYYKGGTFLAAVGIIISFYRLARNLKSRKFDAADLLIPEFIGGLLTGCLIHVNVNRFNIIHLSMVIFIAVGLKTILEKLSELYRYSFHTAAAVYIIVFACFMSFYTTTYKDNIAGYFQEGIGEAVEAAEEISGGEKAICVDRCFLYPKIMFFSRMPVTDYTETVVYNNYPSAFLDIDKCGNYYFGNYDFDPNFVYIISSDRSYDIPAGDWKVIDCKTALVAYVP